MTSRNATHDYTSTIYPGPKDNIVFNSATIWWSDGLSAPPGYIHPVRTRNITPEEAAFAYERELKSFCGADTLDSARPLFAIALLGLGEDGHLASLFPGHKVLKEHLRWAAAVIGAAPEPRVTLTFPALESSRHAAFLVAGAAKAGILRRFRAGDPALPASDFHPIGELRVFADVEAAGG